MFEDDPCSPICKHCGGEIAVRNPTGKCDHLYWPDLLTDEAKLANGFRLVTRQKWERIPNKPPSGSATFR
jgi:hypothetical protein